MYMSFFMWMYACVPVLDDFSWLEPLLLLFIVLLSWCDFKGLLSLPSYRRPVMGLCMRVQQHLWFLYGVYGSKLNFSYLCCWPYFIFNDQKILVLKAQFLYHFCEIGLHFKCYLMCKFQLPIECYHLPKACLNSSGIGPLFH